MQLASCHYCIFFLFNVCWPSLFLSFLSCKGSGIPKVVNLDVRGELVEGNTIRGYAEVAWCGGTPGKGVAR